MKINQEEFNKLNQLDRIEFRQKEDRIRQRLDTGNMIVYYPMLCCFALITIVIMALSSYNVLGKVTYLRVMNLIPGITFLFIGGFFILLAIEIFVSTLRNKKLEELEREFFKTQVK